MATQTTSGRSKGAATSKPAKPQKEDTSEKKDEPGGLQGLIARRAGRWSLDTIPDDTFQKVQQQVWNLVMDHYFRMEVGGWHRLPEAPSLLIGVHASGVLPIDAYTVGFAWNRHFGPDRPLHGTSHDMLMAAPGIGDYLRRIGTLPAAAKPIAAGLGAGHDVIIWPGGDIDALRPWTQRDRVKLAGRHGFVKLAITSGVPIVPVATTGGSDTLIVLTDGKSIAKRLGLKKLFRSEVFPIAIGFPLGLAPGIIPQIPLPAKIRTEFLEPIDTGDDPERAQDDDFVHDLYTQVEHRLQAGMNRLAGRRTFPLLG